MAVGSVVTLGCLMAGAAVFSVGGAPTVVTVTRHLKREPPVVNLCGPFPPRHATALDVTATGRRLWSTALETRGQNPDADVPPLVAGDTAYVAESGVVHALATSDGRSMWSWAGGRTVYGMWVWRGLIAVLTDQVSDHARLTGLDRRTGAVRWQLAVPGGGLIGDPVATADGGLGWLRSDGALQVVDLGTGSVRWTVARNRQALPVASDGLVLAADDGSLTAFDDETGQNRWTVSGLPPEQVDRVVPGLVVVTSGVVGPSSPTALTALDPVTGRLVWRFDPGTAVTVLSAGPAGLAVATYVPDRRLYLLDLQNGDVRWEAETAITLDTFPIVLAGDIVSVEGGVEGYPGSNLVDRATDDGGLRWKVRVPGTPTGPQPVLRSGSLVAVEASGSTGDSSLFAYDLDDGHEAWRAVMPEFIDEAPVAFSGGFLVLASTPVSGCATSRTPRRAPGAGVPLHDA
ncbi:MAG TPA: PQQ-binding-like beta-propeller repeat protein [Acidimicrobiales bacterium]|nr:PQQ-binding-like beta-propeller repeat protein [Acidimicrobiales bacterium]